MTRLVASSGLIQLVNRTSRIRDERWAYALPCLQRQLSYNFARYWGVDYDLGLVGRNEQPLASAFKVWLLDTSDLAGALGYHEIGDDGRPYGKVFVLDDIKDGVEITVTIDHEIQELAADPKTSRMVWSARDQCYYAIEPCDPVEADQYGPMITVGDSVVRCSNFVTPRYYGLPNYDGSAALDLMGKLSAGVPTLLPGGYQLSCTASGQWHSLTARLSDGSQSTRSKHVEGRTMQRAATDLDMASIEVGELSRTPGAPL